MKTAEQWTSEDGYETLAECGDNAELKDTIRAEIAHRRAIQLDAYKQACKDASKIASDNWFVSAATVIDLIIEMGNTKKLEEL